jgi:hypothetical protein
LFIAALTAIFICLHASATLSPAPAAIGAVSFETTEAAAAEEEEEDVDEAFLVGEVFGLGALSVAFGASDVLLGEIALLAACGLDFLGIIGAGLANSDAKEVVFRFTGGG